MIVAATAGHVDHGKTALVQALTGTALDRLVEERHRGLTLDLGFAWCDLPSGRRAAFVDVPGHERYLRTMLSGLGPVRAALLVVAADQGWAMQSAEHADVLAALGIPQILLVISRCDLADPEATASTAYREMRRRGLSPVASVAVSAHTGQGLDALRAALDQLSPPRPPRSSPVRLWVDRAFTVSGAGTVVTGTLQEGTLRVGDQLALSPAGSQKVPATVRGLQVCEQSVAEAPGPTRVAVNLRRVPVDAVPRGSALLTPDAWVTSAVVDVRLHQLGEITPMLPARVMCHVGTARRPARARQIAEDLAQLRLEKPLPLHVGDRLALRNPTTRDLFGATVLDPMPTPVAGHRAVQKRRLALASATGTPLLACELARRGLLRGIDARRLGIVLPADQQGEQWLIDPAYRQQLTERLLALVRARCGGSSTTRGLTRHQIRDALELPDAQVIDVLLSPELREEHGHISLAAPFLSPALRRAAEIACKELATVRWQVPTSHRWRELGVTPAHLHDLALQGVLVKLAPAVYLTREGIDEAIVVLRGLPAPFPVSRAREVLETTRRVAVPLLGYLDHQGITEKVTHDGLRRLRRPARLS